MTQIKQEINSRALEMVQGLEDKERLVYEIEAETKCWPNLDASFWAVGNIQIMDIFDGFKYWNSQGKHIATFRRKK
jgi:hypothetical protein